MSIVHVNTKPAYDVHIECGAISHVGTYIAPLKNPCKVAIITDDIVGPAYSEALVNSLHHHHFEVETYIVPHGEQHKTPATLLAIVEWLAEKEFTRQDLLIALGGGVIGDITGFAAATYQRGVDYVQIPTTLA